MFPTCVCCCYYDPSILEIKELGCKHSETLFMLIHPKLEQWLSAAQTRGPEFGFMAPTVEAWNGNVFNPSAEEKETGRSTGCGGQQTS